MPPHYLKKIQELIDEAREQGDRRDWVARDLAELAMEHGQELLGEQAIHVLLDMFLSGILRKEHLHWLCCCAEDQVRRAMTDEFAATLRNANIGRIANHSATPVLRTWYVEEAIPFHDMCQP
jgi:hypothetical protein